MQGGNWWIMKTIADRLLAGEILPLSMDPNNGKEVLEKFGVEFLDNPEDSQYEGEFQSVRLPKGWKVFPSPYEQRPNLREKYLGLYDDRGRFRARINYFAKTHEKRAFMALQTRITVSRDVKLYLNNIVIYDIIVDQRPVCETVPVLLEPDRMGGEVEVIAIIDTIEEKIKKLLDENYPDWCNPAAYWDEEIIFEQCP